MNIGISTLKILSCICIVIMHCGHSHRLVGLSVMIFMFTAMFLYARKLKKDNEPSSLCNRLRRIAVPYFAWGIIAAIPFSIFYRSFDASKFACQMLLGSPYDPPLYFMTLLMLYTLLTWALSRLKHWAQMATTATLLFSCWVLQYTGINFSCTEAFTWIPYFPRCTIGRFVELMPPALMGYVIGRNENWLSWRHGCLFGAAGLLSLCANTPSGYDYQGIDLTLLSSCICIAFTTCDRFARKLSLYEKTNKVLTALSGLTMGIYVIHVLIANALSVVTPSLQKGPLLVSIVLVISITATVILQRFRWLSWLVR